MRIERDTAVEQHLFESWAVKELKPREGIHLSDLDLCLKKAYYRKKDIEEGRQLSASNELLLLYMIGWAMQHEVLGETEEEMEVDGVRMSVDAPMNGGFLEFKTTRLSEGKFSWDEHPSWIMRTKGYCYARKESSCGVVVVFLNGDYKPPRPLLRGFKLSFTEEELRENWDEVLRRKEIVERALEVGEPPGVDYHQEWECGMCGFNVPGRCFGKVGKPK